MEKRNKMGFSTKLILAGTFMAVAGGIVATYPEEIGYSTGLLVRSFESGRKDGMCPPYKIVVAPDGSKTYDRNTITDISCGTGKLLRLIGHAYNSAQYPRIVHKPD